MFTMFLSDLPQSNPLVKKDPWPHLVETKGSFTKGVGCSKILLGKEFADNYYLVRHFKIILHAHFCNIANFVSSLILLLHV